MYFCPTFYRHKKGLIKKWGAISICIIFCFSSPFFVALAEELPSEAPALEQVEPEVVIEEVAEEDEEDAEDNNVVEAFDEEESPSEDRNIDEEDVDLQKVGEEQESALEENEIDENAVIAAEEESEVVDEDIVKEVQEEEVTEEVASEVVSDEGVSEPSEKQTIANVETDNNEQELPEKVQDSILDQNNAPLESEVPDEKQEKLKNQSSVVDENLEQVLYEWVLCSEEDDRYEHGRDLTKEELVLLASGSLEEVVYAPLVANEEEKVEFELEQEKDLEEEGSEEVLQETESEDDLEEVHIEDELGDVFIERNYRYCRVIEQAEQEESLEDINSDSIVDIVVVPPEDGAIQDGEIVNDNNTVQVEYAEDNKIQLQVTPLDPDIQQSIEEYEQEVLASIEDEEEENIETQEIITTTIPTDEISSVLEDIQEATQADIVIDDVTGEVQEPNYIFYALAEESPGFDWWFGGDNDVVHQDVLSLHNEYDVQGESVTVAVIDTGVDMSHEDLQESKWTNEQEIPNNGEDDDGNGYVDDVHGWDFYYRDNDPRDALEHGTPVAGMIAADSNDFGTIGVAPKAKILPLKVCSNRGFCPASRVIEAIDYAIAQQVDIMTIALGTPYYSYILHDAVDRAFEAGILVVSSVGNNAQPFVYYPAAYENVLAVGSVDMQGVRADFSHTGESLSFVSPGVDIQTLSPGNDYDDRQGTSLSAGMIVGLFALALDQFPEQELSEIIQAAKDTAVDRFTVGFDDQTGFGSISPLDWFNLLTGDDSGPGPGPIDPGPDPGDGNNGPHSEDQEFFVQHVSTSIPAGTTSVVIEAPHDFIAPESQSTSWVFISNTSATGAGKLSGGGSQNADDVTAFISQGFESSLGSIELSRFGSTGDTYVNVTIVEYIGEQGGPNEIQVRQHGNISYGSNAFLADVSVGGVINEDKVVPWITGQSSPDALRSNYHALLSVSEMTSDTNMRLTRSKTGDDPVAVSYAVIEFIGSNWNIQRIEHEFESAGVIETENIQILGDINRAFIYSQKRAGDPGLDEFGHNAYISGLNTISFQLQSSAAVNDQVAVAWVIENKQTGDSAMKVLRGSGQKTKGGPEPEAWNIETSLNHHHSNTFVSLNTVSSGTGTAYPRAVLAAKVSGANTIQLWRSDNGQEQTYYWEHIQFPMKADAVLLEAQGEQVEKIYPDTNAYLGGSFRFTGAGKLTRVNMSEQGTIRSDQYISDITLFYEHAELCEYDGSETVFDSTLFNNQEKAEFFGEVELTDQPLCLYTVIELHHSTPLDDTIDIALSNPQQDVVVEGARIISPGGINIPGVTTVSEPPSIFASFEGYQVSEIAAGDLHKYAGGKLVIQKIEKDDELREVTFTNTGGVDADTAITQVSLYYDEDESYPYTCDDHSFQGDEPQFGVSSLFSSQQVTFIDKEKLSTKKSLCLYLTVSLYEDAPVGGVLDISIQNPNQDIVLKKSEIESQDPLQIPGITSITKSLPNVFRVKEYFVDEGMFTGKDYNLVLDDALKENHFIFVRGASNGAVEELGKNLVKNGSFEDDKIPSTWGAVEGGAKHWDTDSEYSEIQTDQLFGPAVDGKQYLELDHHYLEDNIYQDLNIHEKNTYKLNFYLSPRPNVASDSQGVEVVWNNEVLDTIYIPSSNALQWKQYSYEVVGQKKSRLEFQDISKNDSLGILIDNVELREIKIKKSSKAHFDDTGPGMNYARVTALPPGKNKGLSESLGDNIVKVSRFDDFGDWVGVITVVESLAAHPLGGFRVLDIQEVTTPQGEISGSFSSAVSWSNINQVSVFGGNFASGSMVESLEPEHHASAWSRWYPLAANTVHYERYNAGNLGLFNASHTVYVVEWGNEWKVQHATINKTAGGKGVDSVSEYSTTSIAPVHRKNTWVWGTGYSTSSRTGSGAEGQVVTLGNGVDQNQIENMVSVGAEYADLSIFDVYTFSHRNLHVSHYFSSSNHQNDLVVSTPTVPAPYGLRMSLVKNSLLNSKYPYPRPIMFSKYKGDASIDIIRNYAGSKFSAWLQGINYAGIKDNSGQVDILSVDIVDASGASVVSPAVVMGAMDYNFEEQISSGVLGTSDQKIVVSNYTDVSTWSVSLAASGGAIDNWKNGPADVTFPYNGTEHYLSVDTSAVVANRGDGGSTAGIQFGPVQNFESGVIDSVTLFTSTSAQPQQSYVFTGVDLSQLVPPAQAPETYTLNMVLTVL